MRVLLHCDGAPDLGVGHVVRSLALAEEAAASGHEVTLVGTWEGDFLERLVERSGVATARLTRDEDRTDALRRLRSEVGAEVVHVDSYLADLSLTGLGEAVTSTMQDGVFGSRPADLVVDPNLGADLAASPPGARALLRGSRAIPLRRLVTARRGRYAVADEVRRVLVVMGGTDARGIAPRVVSLLAATGRPLEVTVLTQREAPATVEEQALKVTYRRPVEDLPGLMLEQDLVVSAAGTSVWELCCLGVPMALVCAVDNQQEGYQRVVDAGAALGLGVGAPDPARLPDVEEVIADRALRTRRAQVAASLVDGLGAWRVVCSWEQLAARRPRPVDASRVTARPATVADAELLLAWRNDPVTRCSSRSRDEVSEPEHRSWLERTLTAPDRLLLVGEDAAGPVGTVRWDARGPGAWEVSVTVAPDRRGESLAHPLLRAGELALCAGVPEVRTLVAFVHEDNPASRALFAAAGYLPDRRADADGFLGLAREPTAHI